MGGFHAYRHIHLAAPRSQSLRPGVFRKPPEPCRSGLRGRHPGFRNLRLPQPFPGRDPVRKRGDRGAFATLFPAAPPGPGRGSPGSRRLFRRRRGRSGQHLHQFLPGRAAGRFPGLRHHPDRFRSGDRPGTDPEPGLFLLRRPDHDRHLPGSADHQLRRTHRPAGRRHLRLRHRQRRRRRADLPAEAGQRLPGLRRQRRRGNQRRLRTFRRHHREGV